MVSRSLTADQGQEPRVGELLERTEQRASMQRSSTAGHCQLNVNPSCHLLKSMGFCLTLTVKSPISSQEEQAHGRQNYSDVLSVRRSVKSDTPSRPSTRSDERRGSHDHRLHGGCILPWQSRKCSGHAQTRRLYPTYVEQASGSSKTPPSSRNLCHLIYTVRPDMENAPYE